MISVFLGFRWITFALKVALFCAQHTLTRRLPGLFKDRRSFQKANSELVRLTLVQHLQSFVVKAVSPSVL